MKAYFRENLRLELDYLGLTVKELSVKTGIAKGTLDCYLGARASMPPADIAVKIAAVLKVSVEYLITGHETIKPDQLLRKLFDEHGFPHVKQIDGPALRHRARLQHQLRGFDNCHKIP